MKQRTSTESEDPLDTLIDELNAKHAVVREGGRTLVITEEMDPVLKRRVLTRSSFTDIRQYYGNQFVEIATSVGAEPRRMGLGEAWLHHSRRRQFEGVVFSPGEERPGFLNLWKGFGVERRPGDWTVMRYHIEQVICSGQKELFEYVMGWMAATVQRPADPIEVALAMRGGQGTGKGVFAREFGGLFGQHFVHISNPRHLTGNFNAHLQDAVVVFADEAFGVTNRESVAALKMLITEPTIPVEQKGRDVFFVKNVIHLIMASNEDWVIPAGLDERRFCVLEVSDCHRQDQAYFGALFEEMAHGGREAMLDDLLRYDYSGVSLRHAPATEALRTQKLLSMKPNERWWYEILVDGRLLPDHSRWEKEVLKDDLHESYLQTMRSAGIFRKDTRTELGMFLQKVLPAGYPQRFQRYGAYIPGVKGSRPARKWCWGFPSLSECRAHFDAITNSKHEWPEVDDDMA